MKSSEKKLLRAIRGADVDSPPVWLMRQAGRYLPEYRATREQAGGFLDLCYTPDLAVEVTLQPIRRFGFDASIMFSDILVVPHAMGRNVWFVTGEGPRLDPMSPGERLTLNEDAFHAHLEPVYQVLEGLRASLPKETALIGFAGAPWTLATYMAAGRGTPDQGPARKWLFSDPDSFGALIDVLTDAVITYLDRQITRGAEVVQLFDSWAGALSPNAYDAYCVAPTKRIVETLKARHPETPIIGFPRAVGAAYVDFVQRTGVDVVGIDQRVLPEWAAKTLQPHCAVQGNLDPMNMVIGGDGLLRDVDRIMEALAGGPFIFNLGHGITPDAVPANVEALLRRVRG